MTNMPTIQDFLDAYERTSAKPIKGQFGAVVSDGFITCKDGDSCCPLTALCLGLPMIPGFADSADCVCRHIHDKYPRFDYWDFVRGFDYGGLNDSPATQLGRDLRKTLEDLGWFK
jgi:hypothetical protein